MEAKNGRLLTAAVITLVCLAVGVGAYFVARTGGEDLDAARTAGAAEGRAAGAAEGSESGYAEGFKEGRKESYAGAYEKAYAEAYLAAFEEAGLDAPKKVKVKTP